MNNSMCLLDANFCIHLEFGNLEHIFELFIKEFDLDVRITSVIMDELRIKTIPLEIDRMIHSRIITTVTKDASNKSYKTPNKGEKQIRDIALQYMSQERRVVVMTTDNDACNMMSDNGISNMDLFGFVEIANRRGLLGRQQAVEAMAKIRRRGTRFAQARLDALHAKLS